MSIEGVNRDVNKVSELFITGTRNWNLNLLHQLFDHNTAEAISRIHVYMSEEEDKLIWMPHTKGIFSAKSMYMHLARDTPSGSNSSIHVNDFQWSKLWQIQGIAPIILLFLWRTLNGGLDVGSKLQHILGTNKTCTACNSHLETVQHALLHCPTVTLVWEASGLLRGRSIEGRNIAEFFSQLLRDDVDSFRLGCAILWVIWKTRNNRIFNGATMETEGILRQAHQLSNEYKNPMEAAYRRDDDHDGNQITANNWVLPSPGIVKINIDGACQQGLIASGAVIRDSNGTFLGCATMASSTGTPLEAEAQGISLALQLIHELNLSHVVIESDAKCLVDSVSMADPNLDWRINHVIKTCMEFLSTRAANNTVHVLAAYALTHEVTDRWIGGLPPPFLLDALFVDLATNVIPDSING